MSGSSGILSLSFDFVHCIIYLNSANYHVHSSIHFFFLLSFVIFWYYLSYIFLFVIVCTCTFVYTEGLMED